MGIFTYALLYNKNRMKHLDSETEGLYERMILHVIYLEGDVVLDPFLVVVHCYKRKHYVRNGIGIDITRIYLDVKGTIRRKILGFDSIDEMNEKENQTIWIMLKSEKNYIKIILAGVFEKPIRCNWWFYERGKREACDKMKETNQLYLFKNVYII